MSTIKQYTSAGEAGADIAVDDAALVLDKGAQALKDVSFHIPSGEFVFIMGTSGSGKSTIIKLLLKELEPTKGRIIVGEKDLKSINRRQIPAFLSCDTGCAGRERRLHVGW